MGKVSQNEEPYMEGAILHSGRDFSDGNLPSMVHYKKSTNSLWCPEMQSKFSGWR